LEIEADDGQVYIAKLRASAKTARRLIAEVIAGQIGQIIGLPQPAMVFLEVDGSLATHGLDEEKSAELAASTGLIFGSQKLEGARSMSRRRDPGISPSLAADLVWFDALVLNNDRKWRNPNILQRGDDLWVIDNDSAFSLHHRWAEPAKRRAYQITPAHGRLWWEFREHAVLPWAGSVAEAGERLAALVTPESIARAVAAAPEPWLAAGFPDGCISEPRRAYQELLEARLAHRSDFESLADDLRFHGLCYERPMS
jgi:hypothetical protein